MADQEHQKIMLVISDNPVLGDQRNELLDKVSSYTFQKQEFKMGGGLHLNPSSETQCTKRTLRAAPIDRAAPIPWSPKRLDLTTLDFFFWGYIKNIVYTEKVRDSVYFREQISAAVTTVKRAWDKVDYRIDICRAQQRLLTFKHTKV